ncbi:MAG: carbohydrate ABC transporter permease, partial [Thermomicrobiales bacterium]
MSDTPFSSGATTAGGMRQPPAAMNGPRLKLRHREALAAFASILPAFLLVLVIVWAPTIQSFRKAFTAWNGITAEWVGLDNFRDILASDEFWTALRTNLLFVLAIPGILLICLVVSVVLFEQIPGWKFFRSVYYIPTILSAAVVGMLMRILFATQGPVNGIFGAIGLGALQQDWLSSIPTAFVVLIFVFYWQTLGQGVLIFLAGLAAIPNDLIEAAVLEGATWWQRLFGIVIPQLLPAIAYFVIFNLVWAFVGLFAIVYTVTNGGPGYGTTSVDLYIYRKAFEQGQLGYASALSVI